MKKFACFALAMLFFSSCATPEPQSPAVKPPKSGPRKPSQVQPCVTFDGAGAKKTFTTLYPFTQGRVTAIVAEETRMGETEISTENIFCRVYKVGLPQDAQKQLEAMDEKSFQCGYFISSEGNLTACSDPL